MRGESLMQKKFKIVTHVELESGLKLVFLIHYNNIIVRVLDMKSNQLTNCFVISDLIDSDRLKTRLTILLGSSKAKLIFLAIKEYVSGLLKDIIEEDEETLLGDASSYFERMLEPLSKFSNHNLLKGVLFSVTDHPRVSLVKVSNGMGELFLLKCEGMKENYVKSIKTQVDLIALSQWLGNVK